MSDEDRKTTVSLNLPASFGKPETTNQKPETAAEPAKPLLVKIERIAPEHGKTPEEKAAIKELLANGPLIRLPYEDGSGSTEHYDFAADKNVFQVSVIVADAAVATGCFRAV